MKVDGHISGTARPILLIFGQIGANNVNFSKSHMRADTRFFLDGLGFMTCESAITGPDRVPFSAAKMQALHVHEMGPDRVPFCAHANVACLLPKMGPKWFP